MALDAKREKKKQDKRKPNVELTDLENQGEDGPRGGMTAEKCWPKVHGEMTAEKCWPKVHGEKSNSFKTEPDSTDWVK